MALNLESAFHLSQVEPDALHAGRSDGLHIFIAPEGGVSDQPVVLQRSWHTRC